MEYMAYMGQFVRATIHHTDTIEEWSHGNIPYEVANAIIFLEQLVQYAGFERSVLNSVIPNATVVNALHEVKRGKPRGQKCTKYTRCCQ